MIWAKPFGKRCKARLSKSDSPDYYGRCELAPHHKGMPHALERGMIIVRFATHNWVEPS